MRKFESFELLCKQTNRRFQALERDPLFSGDAVWLHSATIQKISRILGSYDPEELADCANWGPGATTRISGRNASSANKFQSEIGITRDLYHFLVTARVDAMLEFYPPWRFHLDEMGFPHFEVGNKVVTVPKDATTDRVIAIEPGLNLWFQKAVGAMIGRRLLRWGIDLTDQGRNQFLAKRASNDVSLATIDFSSASDSIATYVVESLLPSGDPTRPGHNWLDLLNNMRSHFGLINGKQVRWNKFSSMGNGFTFQLQSLIFFAIALCCCDKKRISSVDVSVYGDDVIIPMDIVDSFSMMCEFYGFRINRKKSHFDSVFRESCGAHYYRGIDVKPVYLKGKLSTVPAVYRLANAVRRLGHRRNSYGCDFRFQALFDSLVKSVPKEFRFRIPETLGDGGFIANFDEAHPTRAKHGVEGHLVQNVVEESVKLSVDGVGLLFARLWVSSVMMLRNTVTSRGRTRLSLKRSLVAQWYDLGPWC